MFAALCEMPEFFRDRMLLYVAIAPIISVKNMNSPLIQKAKGNKAAYFGLQKMGPEIMATASASNAALALVTTNYASM